VSSGANDRENRGPTFSRPFLATDATDGRLGGHEYLTPQTVSMRICSVSFEAKKRKGQQPMFAKQAVRAAARRRIGQVLMRGPLVPQVAVALAVGWALSQDALAQPPSPTEEPRRPNVLFIAVDDLNDWTTLYDKANPIRTPQLERLAKMGVMFTRAYCSSPACNPSRVATMTGLSPTTTGVYGNASDWRRALPTAVTLSQHFMAHGYRAVGAGKIFHHHHEAYHDDASFHDFLPLAKDPAPPKRLNGITNWVGGRGNGPVSGPFDWGPWPPEESQTPDAKTVDYACRFLARTHQQPFFLAVGIFRPHSPWYAPAEHFDRYPLDQLVMPELLEGDLDDLPSGGRTILQKGKPFIYKTMAANNQVKQATQAYQACASFADRQIGRLLDALAKTAYARNTIVVLWSDHGFHVGEKRHWEKFALWEKSTRTPLIIVAPEVARRNVRCRRPVSLLDIYPTLVELCDLSPNPALEGNSLVSLLREPQSEWNRPAVMTWGRGNHAVRSGRWRYIQYEDGTHELYDHRSDPHEWFNLSGKPGSSRIIRDLRKWLPKHEAPAVPDLAR